LVIARVLNLRSSEEQSQTFKDAFGREKPFTKGGRGKEVKGRGRRSKRSGFFKVRGGGRH